MFRGLCEMEMRETLFFFFESPTWECVCKYTRGHIQDEHNIFLGGRTPLNFIRHNITPDSWTFLQDRTGLIDYCTSCLEPPRYSVRTTASQIASLK